MNKNNRYPWLVLTVTSLGVLLVLLNYGTLNVVLPDIVTSLHAGPVEAGWILLSYMLVNTILILVFGRLADMFGRRNLYLLGFGVFTAASFIAGFSPSVGILIGMRICQAVGGAMVITNTTALLADSFPAHLLSKGLGANVLISSVAQLIGPLAGGLLAEYLSWRWVFWFSVPLGIVGVLWGLLILRKDEGTEKKAERFDLRGSVLIFCALGGLILALTQGGVEGWTDPWVIAGFSLFIVLFPSFLWLERRTDQPLVDLTLFHNRAYAMAFVSVFLNAVARFAVVLLLSLYFQSVEGDSPFTAGLKTLPETIGMLIASPAAGSLAVKYSPRLLSTAGLGITAVGLLTLVCATGSSPQFGLLVFAQFCTGFGSGFFMTPNTTFIMTEVPVQRRGIANGLRSMLQNMGTVISSAVSLAVITSSLSPALKHAIYAGKGANLTAAGIRQMASGYQAAFLIMLAATLIGMAASYMRGSKREEAAARHVTRKK